jgi:beta-N-acetylhexosaminidase
MNLFDVDALTDRQLAGQRLMVGFEGTTFNDRLHDVISELAVGGLILFKRNVVDPQQLESLCRKAQEISEDSGNPPLLIAIDQEGGPVARLGAPFTVFPGNRVIGDTRSEEAAVEFGRVSAEELKGIGVNLNFAPVLDVVPPELVSPVMDDRVFGNDPELVAQLGRVVIESLQNGGVCATAKHFPGIGRTTLDSHLDLPFLDTDYEVLESSDLIPFIEAIACGVGAVMLSHIVYTRIDPDWPAGLSSVIGKVLLREKLGFKGVSFTDDLDMGAINKHYDVTTFVERICQAEVDMALICHDEDKMQASYERLLQGIHSSEEIKKKTVTSVKRILELKSSYAMR